MDVLLAGIGWFFGLCGLAVLIYGADIALGIRTWLERDRRP